MLAKGKGLFIFCNFEELIELLNQFIESEIFRKFQDLTRQEKTR